MNDDNERAEHALEAIVFVAGGTSVGVETARALLRIAQALERIADNTDFEMVAIKSMMHEDYGVEL